MDDIQAAQLQETVKKTQEQLKETQHYIKEIQIQHSIGALILAGLVAVVFQAFSYLIYGVIVTDLDRILFMFSFLVGPSAFFLLLLHLYEFDGIVKRGEKSIPLTLDLMYFLYLALSFATMIGLYTYYQRHSISWNFLTTGWNIAAVLLCAEVILSLLLAKYIVTIFIMPKLPHFFEHKQREERPKPLPIQHHTFTKPRQVYYFREKPDISMWEEEVSFVRYKP
jgi:hypothetical protein